MIYIIMGVSGCGKSSFGAFLSEKLGWPLHEGDSFHPEENVAKMSRGEALTDQDRFPWLLRLHDVIESERRSDSNALVACSALKRLYRLILLHGSKALPSSSSSSSSPPGAGPPLPSSHPDVCFLFLHGAYDLIHQRMVARMGHYMKADLLGSQFDALEPPLKEQENVVLLDIRRSVPDMAMEVEMHLSNLKNAQN
ncbi:probable gluconokinase [Dunckerocampus dactyliophorus]|uniref:probable gluconokinase n=1 Tax=Dunckerocampus dactyliophorus TaxID=161453 RepID=UPI0024064590|nr:probable gluconokinase [Dunckerocampus dactyliophorus]XP_054630434.1 probable gluconokinase [Dunckerocampus dactyliophorus]